ncbi:Peptidyl-tRNA hydrolase, PTH2 family and Cytochrome c oxidase assembly protein COX16 family and Peptidyl-tRNA hydrolase II domain-containing protein [Strongyloides ratti]|uniref:peptidyl-tRNA hydrolase n=1 Tax=Strongyloides ratti TaxID=34506 RepID=A0A090LJ81_STRRB|nr:Peptidyl-tRNA hydrolase, PTH2 family and Cytochrome c oxidase assembly protein COX16 family and Peptidyl-tRNA hydrolase II domain-containing protein [Strongyloides ratti]CEF69773.1 Peptidyl-tRNA hydrolase, PTH2 family and Cytochrome c oxidase assembly protein COX16 family and Peptidyl-tRNA hydrolase II domain-containing protein [Strongyloides ratti]
MSKNSTWNFLKKGLPFFSIVVGGAYGLHFFQKVRYDFRKIKQEEVAVDEVKGELKKVGIKVKDKVTIDNIFEEIVELDTESWENIREEQEDKEKKEIDTTEIVTEEDKQLYYDEVVGCIIEFGISDNIETALLAAKRTYPQGVDAAIDWIIERSNQSDFASSSSSSDSEEIDLKMGGYTSQPISEGLFSDIKSLSKSLRKYKMVLVANMALGMGKGKLAAQVGHAVLGTYKNAMKTPDGQKAISHWEKVGQVKVVVKGQDTEHLMDIFKASKDKGLWTYIVQDAGYTQIPPGSRTVVGIFGPVEDIDEITGSLKLL